MNLIRKISIILAISSVLSFIGCSDGGDSGSSTGSGTVSVSLVDQTTYDYQAVYITIDDVQIHLGGNVNSHNNWQSTNMLVSPNTVNLLELVSGVREDLGLAELQTGRYTQMRLIIGKTPDDSLNILSQKHPFANYVIVNSNSSEIHELKVPSGNQTGEKIVGGFEIFENQTTELILDFNVQKSVVKAGNSGQWLLKPTIKLAELVEFSRIEGRVTDNAQVGLEGVQVSAQVFNDSASDEKDKVIVEAFTLTNQNGYYTLFVEPGSYSLVVYGDGYNPQFDSIATSAGEVLPDKDFTLMGATIGAVEGLVTINGGGPEQYATLSFRQEVSTVQIQIDSINEMNMTDYSIFLPEGNYNLVASTFGYRTEVYPNVEVILEDPEIPTNQDVVFDEPIN
ncbi:MAG: DUF4382 domain-containing protein [Deltaproteobacteria bacterium]|nr:MAG: DUF4382 domain-containing protein [Deltaproteobacteria bacterium]